MLQLLLLYNGFLHTLSEYFVFIEFLFMLLVLCYLSFKDLSIKIPLLWTQLALFHLSSLIWRWSRGPKVVGCFSHLLVAVIFFLLFLFFYLVIERLHLELFKVGNSLFFFLFFCLFFLYDLFDVVKFLLTARFLFSKILFVPFQCNFHCILDCIRINLSSELYSLMFAVKHVVIADAYHVKSMQFLLFLGNISLFLRFFFPNLLILLIYTQLLFPLICSCLILISTVVRIIFQLRLFNHPIMLFQSFLICDFLVHCHFILSIHYVTLFYQQVIFLACSKLDTFFDLIEVFFL